jgi:hypothetical protein
VVLDLGAQADAGAPTEPLARRAPRLPGWVQIAAALVLTVNVAVLLLGTAAAGASVDEPIHAERLSTYLNSGWYLPEVQMDGTEPAAGVRGLAVYGPAMALVGHSLAVVLGSEEPGAVAVTPEAFAHRHVAVALISLVAFFAVGLTARLLLGGWRWGLLAAAGLSAIPVWTGHAMFNIKDVPVATGYSLVTCGCVALVGGKLAASRARQVIAVCGVAAGSVLAVGTRPGMTVAVGASVMLALLVGTWSDRRAGVARRWVGRSALAAGALVVAAAVLVVVYPALFTRPALLLDAVIDSGEYPWEGTVLTGGRLVTMPPPPDYLLQWFLAQTPLVLLALAVPGLLAPFWLLTRRGSRTDDGQRQLGSGLMLVTVQALFLPLVAVATSAVLYDGTRQMLFVQPAAAVAAVAGLWLMARSLGARRRAANALYVAAVVGLVVPTLGQVRLFPYGYTWFNAVTASRPIDGRWMTDYWRVSSPALVAATPEGGPLSCYLWTATRLVDDCRTQPHLTPYVGRRGTSAHDAELKPGEYYLARVNLSGQTVPEGCTVVHEVTRPLFGQDVLMSAVSRCTIPVLPYPRGGITSADGAGVGYFVAGWVDPADDPVRSYRVPATIGFELPDRLRGSDLRLGIAVRPAEPVDDPLTVAVVVNGVAVADAELAADPGGPAVVDVPARAASALDGRVYVEITLRAADADVDGRPRVIASSVSGLTVRAAR